MRYPASEKLEIIQLVERSHLPVKQTLAKIGVSRPTFYRGYDLYRRVGEAGLEDRRAGPKRPAWNRIPDDVRGEVIDMALDKPDLSPRELAVTFTDEKAYFVSEASVYRLLKAHGLITSPAFIVMKAASEFKDKTTAPNQLWQTDFIPACAGTGSISKSPAGAGSICRPSSMTSRATSWLGSCPRR
jgi:transposase-like protein